MLDLLADAPASTWPDAAVAIAAIVMFGIILIALFRG